MSFIIVFLDLIVILLIHTRGAFLLIALELFDTAEELSLDETELLPSPLDEELAIVELPSAILEEESLMHK